MRAPILLFDDVFCKTIRKKDKKHMLKTGPVMTNQVVVYNMLTKIPNRSKTILLLINRLNERDIWMKNRMRFVLLLCFVFKTKRSTKTHL